MKKNAILVVVVVILQLFMSCKEQGSKFVGTWKNINDNGQLVVITKSGKNFIVDFKGSKSPAFYDEANDKLSANNVGTNFDLIIDEKSNYLLFVGNQFQKE